MDFDPKGIFLITSGYSTEQKKGNKIPQSKDLQNTTMCDVCVLCCE